MYITWNLVEYATLLPELTDQCTLLGRVIVEILWNQRPVAQLTCVNCLVVHESCTEYLLAHPNEAIEKPLFKGDPCWPAEGTALCMIEIHCPADRTLGDVLHSPI